MAVYTYSRAPGYQRLMLVSPGLPVLDGTPRGQRWEAPPARVVHDDPEEGPLRPGDFPRIGPPPVLSARAVEALADLLAPCGELLALDTDEGDYALLNVTAVIDALDVERSDLVRLKRSGKITAVRRYVLRSDRLGDAAVFKLPQLVRSHAYVTDRFVERVRAAGLVGLGLREVWPGPGHPVVPDTEPVLVVGPQDRPPSGVALPPDPTVRRDGAYVTVDDDAHPCTSRYGPAQARPGYLVEVPNGWVTPQPQPPFELVFEDRPPPAGDLRARFAVARAPAGAGRDEGDPAAAAAAVLGRELTPLAAITPQTLGGAQAHALECRLAGPLPQAQVLVSDRDGHRFVVVGAALEEHYRHAAAQFQQTRDSWEWVDVPLDFDRR